MTKKQKKTLKRIIIAAVLTAVLALLFHFAELPWFVQLVLWLVPYLVIGHDVLRKAFMGIKSGEVFDENFLMAVATVGAMGCGEYAEGVAVMLFYQIGELFQSVAVGKSRKNIAALMDIRPDYANVVQDGKLVSVDPDEVEIGQTIVVKAGEKIPIDGVVISRAVEEGQTVAAGFETPTLFTIANDLTQMQVVADVDEADIGQVADGQRVQFSVDAYPDDTFEGTVLQVRLEATTESNVVTYEVVIDAPNPDLKLKPGLTANVTIFTLEKDDATAVPTKALRFVPNAELLGEIGLTAVETDSQAAPGSRELWVKEGTTLRPRRVYAGAASGDMTEITEGLTGSEEIVTGLVTAKPREETAAIERSPFMPGPPGSNDKKK